MGGLTMEERNFAKRQIEGGGMMLLFLRLLLVKH